MDSKKKSMQTYIKTTLKIKKYKLTQFIEKLS